MHSLTLAPQWCQAQRDYLNAFLVLVIVRIPQASFCPSSALRTVNVDVEYKSRVVTSLPFRQGTSLREMALITGISGMRLRLGRETGPGSVRAPPPPIPPKVGVV